MLIVVQSQGLAYNWQNSIYILVYQV